jgi:hypothetical protein
MEIDNEVLEKCADAYLSLSGRTKFKDLPHKSKEYLAMRIRAVIYVYNKQCCPKKQGFACLDKAQRVEIAKVGGKSVPANKRAFSVNRGLAVKAGKKRHINTTPKV